ncbi:hypothetical protein BGZ47_009441 [Haplosporangium gracile]|nr:hypothetical protein BGZ47_009441 [Haplosporangium gracile]
MATNTLTLFCLISGDSTSCAFKVRILDTYADIGDLKKAIIGENPGAFEHIDAKDLVLWRVTIPVNENAGDEHVIKPDDLDDKTKLGNPRTHLSKLFPETPDDNTYIVVERLKATSTPHTLELEAEMAEMQVELEDLRGGKNTLNPEMALIRRQLFELEEFQAEVTSSFINIGIIVKPEKRVVFTWSTVVETATLDDLRKEISELYPQYAHDEYLQIFLYSEHPKPERIRDDDDLRRILRVTRTTVKPRWIISLETPSKSFGNWTFKEVCEEYNLSVASEPELAALKPFTGIQSAPLETDVEKATLDLLIKEIEARAESLPLNGGNEATKSMVVASFLVAATRLFKDDLYLMSQRQLSGRRGNGPVDFSVHPRKTHDYTLGVTEAKRSDLKQGVAQNIVQLEAALTEKKRKREKYDLDGDENPPSKQSAYGIVTDAERWAFVEFTMDEDEAVSIRMSWLSETLNFSGD